MKRFTLSLVSMAPALLAMSGAPKAHAGAGAVAWTFTSNGASVVHRPVVGPDGTVYFMDSFGIVYALTATGSPLWTFNTGGDGFDGPVAVGPDGSIYAAGDPPGPDLNIIAIDPDGAQQWVFTTQTQELVAGLNVGPDGAIYAVTDIDGIGAFSLAPDGSLRWSDQAGFSDFGTSGSEIVFGGPGQLYCNVQSPGLTAFTLNGNQQWANDTGANTEQVAVGPDGSAYTEAFVTGAGIRLQSYSARGDLQWTFFPAGTNVISAPDVGADGVIYIVRNLFQIFAINPDGTLNWQVADANLLGPATANTSLYAGPVVSPDNSFLVVAGRIGFGQPGIAEAYNVTDGQLLWNLALPGVPTSRPRFANTTGRFYVVASGPNNEGLLIAIDTGATPSADLNGDGVVNGADLAALLAQWGTNGSADLNGDGVVNGADLATLLTNWTG